MTELNPAPLTQKTFSQAKIKGIGLWTANIYLLTVLRRPDIWPREDLALAIATQILKRLKTRPTQQALENLSTDVKPWRAVAARLLWHYYLNRPKEDRKKSTDRMNR